MQSAVKTSARIAFESLRREGLSPERIAGIAKATTTAVRLWQRGLEIPAGAAMRLVIAARVFMALKQEPAVDRNDSCAEIAAFARGWLAAHSRVAQRIAREVMGQME